MKYMHIRDRDGVAEDNNKEYNSIECESSYYTKAKTNDHQKTNSTQPSSCHRQTTKTNT